MHFCHEEVLGLLAIAPFLKAFVARVRFWFHSRKNCPHPPEKVFYAEQLEDTGGLKGPGWFFWTDKDDIWAQHGFAVGPYPTKKLAKRDLKNHLRLKKLNAAPPSLPPPLDNSELDALLKEAGKGPTSTWDAKDTVHYVDGGIS